MTTWIQTFSGTQFFPLAPRMEDISIIDIAEALSKQCRFGGHSQRFYCPLPEQRVLTADLRWVPAGDLKVGSELLAFDESPIEVGSCGKRRRRYRHAVVIAHVPVRRSVIRLEMADGSTVRSSTEHPWLVATKQSRNQKWLTAGQIKDDLLLGRKRYMHKFLDPWKEAVSKDAGWLAGIMDGEGHISIKHRSGVQFGVAQRPGLVLDQIRRVVTDFGFGKHMRQTPVGVNDVQSIQLNGGWRNLARMLGEIRPIRLLDKFVQALRTDEFGKQMDGLAEPLQIVTAWSEEDDWVSGLQTSTHTYLCEGYAAHNSVAEHSVLVSRLVAPPNMLWGLMHDAAEAYLVDLPRPLKLALPQYKVIEDRLLQCIAERYELGPFPDEVNAADNAMLMREKLDLMAKPPAPWAEDGIQPAAIHPLGLSPTVACREFLDRFAELVYTELLHRTWLDD